MNIQISASMLSADFGSLEQELNRVKQSGCDMIHFDVMDGHFVPNISYGVPVLKSIKKYNDLPFDVHLMISDPLFYAEPFANAGADLITFHVEAVENCNQVIEKIHSLGLKAGISVKPKTPVSEIFPYLDKIEMVLVMTVEPGFGGQGFIYETLDKIKELKQEIDSRGLSVDIEVDGGICDTTCELVKQAGANILVSGSYLFNSKDMTKEVKILKG